MPVLGELVLAGKNVLEQLGELIAIVRILQALREFACIRRLVFDRRKECDEIVVVLAVEAGDGEAQMRDSAAVASPDTGVAAPGAGVANQCAPLRRQLTVRNADRVRARCADHCRSEHGVTR